MERITPPVYIHKGLQKAEADLSRYQNQPVKGHLEKGRKPINEREEILDKVAKLTNTSIPRWCRYSEQELKRAYIRFGEVTNVRNKAAYFIWLIKNP